MRWILFCAFLGFCCPVAPAVSAAQPKAVALEAITTLFVNHDIEKFKAFVDADAIQGDRGAGTALVKIGKQKPEMMKVIELSQVIFFRADDIGRLSKRYPDDLWVRVQKHIGQHQGVLVKLALTGAAAERAKAAGKDPKDIAMMTFVLGAGADSKIIHVDDN